MRSSFLFLFATILLLISMSCTRTKEDQSADTSLAADTITGDQDTYTWWVLEENGELLGRFEWPRNRMLKMSRGGYAYALIEDFSGTGFTHIERYKVNIKPNTIGGD